MVPTKTLIVLTIQAMAFQIAFAVILGTQGKARPALIQLLSDLGLQESDYRIEELGSEPPSLTVDKIKGSYYEKIISITKDGQYVGKANSEDEVIEAELVGENRLNILKNLRALSGKVWKIVAYPYWRAGSSGDDNAYTGNSYVDLVFFGVAPKIPVQVQPSIITPPVHFSSTECITLIIKLLDAMQTVYKKEFVDKEPSRWNVYKTAEMFMQDELVKYTNK